MMALLLLCSCTARMDRYPTKTVDLFFPMTEREQKMTSGQQAGIECTAPSGIKGVTVWLPENAAVDFLLYIYPASGSYEETVGKKVPALKKEVHASASQGSVTVYFNGPQAGRCYVVLEPQTDGSAVFCLSRDGTVGYLDGHVSLTVPKISLLCE